MVCDRGTKNRGQAVGLHWPTTQHREGWEVHGAEGEGASPVGPPFWKPCESAPRKALDPGSVWHQVESGRLDIALGRLHGTVHTVWSGSLDEVCRLGLTTGVKPVPGARISLGCEV